MMSDYFKNKFRINSMRLQHWNYSWPAMYYVTICSKDRICCMAEIKNNQVYLSEIGKIVFNEWLNTEKLRQYILLDDFIIMPNHLHGIIVIEDNDFGTNCRDRVHPVSTGHKFGHVKPKSLSTIINTFKGAVTRQCHKINLNFQWQPKFYEHIINSQDDYARIKEYIANNPINWDNDQNNPVNFK